MPVACRAAMCPCEARPRLPARGGLQGDPRGTSVSHWDSGVVCLPAVCRAFWSQGLYVDSRVAFSNRASGCPESHAPGVRCASRLQSPFAKAVICLSVTQNV